MFPMALHSIFSPEAENVLQTIPAVRAAPAPVVVPKAAAETAAIPATVTHMRRPITETSLQQWLTCRVLSPAAERRKGENPRERRDHDRAVPTAAAVARPSGHPQRERRLGREQAVRAPNVSRAIATSGLLGFVVLARALGAVPIEDNPLAQPVA